MCETEIAQLTVFFMAVSDAAVFTVTDFEISFEHASFFFKIFTEL